MYSVCLFLGLLSFQGNTDASIQERFEVQYVLLDVVATRKNGDLVTDLTLDDFEVTENKKAVDVTFFDILDYRSLSDSGKELVSTTIEVEQGKEKEEPKKPVQQIIIAVDFESVARMDVNRAFAQLSQFLENLDPAIDYQLNLYALDRGSLTKGFTNQVDDVKSALNRYQDVFKRTRRTGDIYDTDLPGVGSSRSQVRTGGYNGGRGSMSTLENDYADFSELEKALQECVEFGRSNTGRGGACSCLNDTINDYMDQHKIRTERVMGELEILAYKFSDNADLKTMLVLSPGFVLYRLNAAMQMLQGFRDISGCGDNRGVSPLAGSLDLDSDFKQVVHACVKNRVIFHTFDLFNGNKAQSRSMSVEYGGRPSNLISQAYRDYNNQITQGLKELAHESGGTFKQVFQLEGSLNKAIEENRYFYVLGYNSPKGIKSKDNFRQIKIKCKRKGVTLRHRRGYFGK